MKLGGFRDGVGYVTAGRTVGTWRPDRGFRARGRIPNPETGVDRVRFGALNARPVKRLLSPVVGTYTTTNVWPVGDDRLLATVGRWLFVSPDGGRSWETARELPASSGPMGVLPTSVCEHDGDVYLAEYTLGDGPARVLVSDDLGETWSTFAERSDVRHFHGLFEDPYTGRLWATTGDADDESAVGYFVDGEFTPVGRGSQRWRAVGLAFTPDAVLWGMDCSFTERVELLGLPRDRLEAGRADPDVVGTTDASVYYVESLEIDGETWVVAATAAEVGGDTTAPPGAQRDSGSQTARVLAAPARSGCEDWRELCAFRRRSTLGEPTGRVPTSNAYVFVATDPDLGLFVNPYNTRKNHGAVVSVAPAAFEAETNDRLPDTGVSVT